ncbi:PAS domain-containing protein, partial [Bacteroides uniformis]
CRALAVWHRERDIPEPETAEREPSILREDFCMFCNRLPVAVLRHGNDRDLTIIQMNGEFLRLVGYTEEEL